MNIKRPTLILTVITLVAVAITVACALLERAKADGANYQPQGWPVTDNVTRTPEPITPAPNCPRQVVVDGCTYNLQIVLKPL